MIVGAGLGGLFLGILLHRAGISLNIFERSPRVRQLGSVVFIRFCVSLIRSRTYLCSDVIINIIIHKPITFLGSSILIGRQIVSLFAQLGLDKELLDIAQPVAEFRVYNEKRELNYTLDFSGLEHLYAVVVVPVSPSLP